MDQILIMADEQTGFILILYLIADIEATDMEIVTMMTIIIMAAAQMVIQLTMDKLTRIWIKMTKVTKF